MKKTALFLVTIVIITLTSCSSDNNDVADASIEGTWKLTSFTTTDAIDFNLDGTATTDFMAETNNCYADNTLVFKADNTVDASGSFLNIDVQIQAGTTDQLTIVTNCTNDNLVATYSWSEAGNNITVTNVGTGVLSGNTLTFTVPNGTQLTTIENNIEVVTLTDVVQVYTKQ